MVKNDPVRLTGTDEEIVAVARHAWRLVASDRETRDVLPAVDQLGRGRRAFMSRFAEPTVAAVGSESVASSALLGVGLLSAVLSAAFAEPVTKRVKIDTTPAMPIILTSRVAAIDVLGVVLIAWRRYRRRPSEMLTVSIIALLIVVAVVVYRFVIGPSGGSTDFFTPAQLAWWQAGAIVMVLELGLLALLAGRSGDGAGRQAGRQYAATGDSCGRTRHFSRVQTSPMLSATRGRKTSAR